MSELAEDRTIVPDALAALYGPVRDELDRVEELLCDELRSDHPFIDRLVQHGFRLSGKRLRPALVLLCGRVAGRLAEEHRRLAAAVELIHTATLVHDDVLDEATMRRHRDTVNARWDNEASVLLGDYLLSLSLSLAASVGDGGACRIISLAARDMCDGELRQVENRGNYGLGEEQYLDIITNKTASLMACCCRLGAHYAHTDAQTGEALARYGRNLGVAFQITDDLLDLLGDEAAAGKSLGTDLSKQKATLPLIRTLTLASPSERQELLDLLSRSGNNRRESVRPWFERFDAVNYAREKAVDFARQAAAELAGLPDSDACRSLLGLTEFVIQRRQ